MVRLYIPERYESRFGLLGAFCGEVAGAARGVGIEVNGSRHAAERGLAQEHAAERSAIQGGAGRAVFVFFNEAGTVEGLRGWMGDVAGGGGAGGGGSEPVVVQWLVDHPLHAREAFVEGMGRGFGAAYRLACVSEDDLHLVSVRWPRVHRLRLWHGVPESALLADGGGAGGVRDVDVLMAGSIATTAELEAMRAQVPPELHRACEEVVKLRAAVPWMSFGQAFDMTMPTGLQCDAAWGLLSVVFRYTTAALNRERRIRLVRGLEGLNVVVAGGSAWGEVCAGLKGVRHVGEVAYGDLPGWMKRTKVCVAANPTQFVHAFSERLLLGLAGGAACVSDDRLWVRHEFGACTRTFPVQEPGALRAQVEALLKDEGERGRLGMAGVQAVRAKHTWGHRVRELVSVLGMA